MTCGYRPWIVALAALVLVSGPACLPDLGDALDDDLTGDDDDTTTADDDDTTDVDPTDDDTGDDDTTASTELGVEFSVSGGPLAGTYVYREDIACGPDPHETPTITAGNGPDGESIVLTFDEQPAAGLHVQDGFALTWWIHGGAVVSVDPGEDCWIEIDQVAPVWAGRFTCDDLVWEMHPDDTPVISDGSFLCP